MFELMWKLICMLAAWLPPYLSHTLDPDIADSCSAVFPGIVVLPLARRLGAGIYFAKLYHAWERAPNENTNGLVRQYFPKGSSFACVTQSAAKKVQNKLNSRPRKVLGYKIPNEVFFAP